MKIVVKTKQLSEAPDLWLRRAGYGRLPENEDGLVSYARRFGRDFYPRFHLYYSISGDQVEFNLHLDQKRPGYAGFNRHNAEYDGEVVEAEAERLSRLLLPDFFTD